MSLFDLFACLPPLIVDISADTNEPILATNFKTETSTSITTTQEPGVQCMSNNRRKHRRLREKIGSQTLVILYKTFQHNIIFIT